MSVLAKIRDWVRTVPAGDHPLPTSSEGGARCLTEHILVRIDGSGKAVSPADKRFSALAIQFPVKMVESGLNAMINYCQSENQTRQ